MSRTTRRRHNRKGSKRKEQVKRNSQILRDRYKLGEMNYKKFPLRTCRWMHECAICFKKIADGQRYYDGGYGRRAHKECIEKD